MGQALPERRTILIVEDDAELRSLTAALLKDEQLDTIECESAEAALAVMLMGGREVAMMFADVWLSGPMDGVDLAREVKMRWPSLPVILTSGRSRESVGKLPPGVTYMPKPWQPLNVLIAAERARVYALNGGEILAVTPSRLRLAADVALPSCLYGSGEDHLGKSPWLSEPERFTAAPPTGIGGCLPAILIPVVCSSGMSPIFLPGARSPTLTSERF